MRRVGTPSLSPSLLSAAYTAPRAAALAGVPFSTLHYWARTGLVTPSVSSIKIKRWSYADLLLLRLVEWLRRDKPSDLPKASVKRIRAALGQIGDLRSHLMDEGLEVYVDHSARLIFEGPEGLYVHLNKGLVQHLVDTRVNLIRPFEVHAGLKGPDLVEPAKTLRIIPGKLSGEPHVVSTRIPTAMLWH